MNANCNIYHQPMRGDARRYPDAMTLADVAEYLNISTKLVSRLVHEQKLFARKVGREYRISKSSVIEFVRGEKKCVVNVTSNPHRWTSDDKCDIFTLVPQEVS